MMNFNLARGARRVVICVAFALFLAAPQAHAQFTNTKLVPSSAPVLLKQVAENFGTWDCAVSPDKSMLLMGAMKRIRGFSLKRNRIEFEIPVSSDCVGVAYAPSGTQFAALLLNGDLLLYNARTLALQITVSRVDYSTGSAWGEISGRPLAYSSDGKWIAAGSRVGNLQLVNVAKGIIARSLAGHGKSVKCVSFSPDDKLVAASGTDNAVKVWSVATGTLQQTLKTPMLVETLDFAPTGRYLLAGLRDENDTKIGGHIIWNTSDWSCKRKLEKAEWIRAAGFLEDGETFFTTGGSACAWSVDSSTPLYKQKLESTIGYLLSGDTILTSSQLGTAGLIVLDLKSGQRDTLMNNPLFSQSQLAVDGKTLFSTSDVQGGQTVMTVATLWDTATMTPLRPSQTVPAFHLVASPDLKLFAGLGYGEVVVYSWDEGFKYRFKERAFGTSFAEGGKVLFAFKNDKPHPVIFKWDMATGKELSRVELDVQRIAGVENVQFSPDGRTLLIQKGFNWDDNKEYAAYLFDTESGKTKGRIALTESKFFKANSALIFTLDNRYVLGTSGLEGENMHLWDANSGAVLRKQSSLNYTVTGITLTPDGKSALICFSCSKALLWNFTTGTTSSMPFRIGDATISPDSKQAYTKWGLEVYDVSSGKRLTTSTVFPPSDGKAAWLTCTEDGFYDASPDASKWFGWQTEDGYKTAEEMEAKYFRPDLVRAALQEPPQAKPELQKPSAKPAQPIQNSPRFTLRPGEIALSGRIIAVDEVAHTLTLLAEKFTLPSGKSSAIVPAKNKTVSWTQPAANTLLVTIVGTESGAGMALIARIVTSNKGT